MTGTIGNEAGTAASAGSPEALWRERVAADAGLGDGAKALFAREDEAFDAVAASVLARSAGTAEAGASRDGGPGAAFAVGRAVCTGGGDLVVLRRLFGHLHDLVAGQLLRDASDTDGHLSAARAEDAVRRTRDAMEGAVVAATRGWFDEAGRKLRHDLKTPLQASSLNLELLTLETAERGLDTEPLDTIQRSLDRIAELLARAEPGAR